MKRHSYSIIFAFLILSLFPGCSENEHSEKEQPTVEHSSDAMHSHHTSAGECKQCHTQIYDEWKSSMHSSSTALKDPLHGAVYKSVMGDPHQSGLTKNGKFPVCLKCHVPFAALDQETDIGSHPIYNEGVSCSVCHSVVEYKGNRGPNGKLRYGVDTFVYKNKDDDHRPEGIARLHPSMDMEKNLVFRKSNQVCMGCHDQRMNGQGTPVCNTGEEYRKAGAKPDCVQCHMPVVDGHVNHGMLAGHDFTGKTQARALRLHLDGKSTASGMQVVATLENRLPHKFPTAAPFRNLVFKIIAIDKSGKEIWSNFKEHPSKEDASAFMKVTFAGEDGKPAPPPKAVGILEDSRLEPYEKREFRYNIPAGEVKEVRAEVLYNLVLPAQAKNEKMNLPDTWKKPVTAGVATWKP